MYNKKDIEKTLIEFNYFIDEGTLSNFIKNWKIDPIYEDEDGVEFYDNMAITKLKKGISLKSQGFSNDQIIYHINKILPEKIGSAKEEEGEGKKEVSTVSIAAGSDMKNLTIDVTNQTLQMLADAVAEKITTGIKDQILQDSTLQKDNLELAQKVDELTEDNKKLAKRIAELEHARRKTLINFEYFLNLFK